MNTLPNPARIHAAKQYAERVKRIPSDKWCVGDYQNSQGQRCFIGHLTDNDGKQFFGHERDFMAHFGISGPATNDRPRNIGGRLVPSPKRNILRALNRIIKGRA